MLFNSYEFIFAFLPATLAGFFALGSVSRTAALRWIIFVSLVFYALWRPVNVVLIAPSILINFVIARTLQRLADDEKRFRASRLVLLLGLAFNIAFLGYFKYVDFGLSTINDIFGTNLVLTHVILPLGYFVHYVSENCIPDRCACQARKVIHSSGLLPVCIVFPAAHRGTYCTLPRDDAAISYRILPL